MQEDPAIKGSDPLHRKHFHGPAGKASLEMVVLSQGLVPSKDMNKIQEMLALQKTSDGFYLEAHPKLQPVDSASRGIFFAGYG